MAAQTTMPLAVHKYPLLDKYLSQLATHPLRTKSLTAAVLYFAQEVLGSNIAGVPVKKQPANAPALPGILAQSHIDEKAFKMALYGLLVSAPLSHYLGGLLQKVFAGKTSATAKVLQILSSNLFVAPITTFAYLISMAVINGSKTVGEATKTVKAGFFPMLRMMWMISPFAMAFAQKFVPPELWVPYGNLIQFTVGLYFNVRVKRMRLAAARKARENKKEEKTA